MKRHTHFVWILIFALTLIISACQDNSSVRILQTETLIKTGQISEKKLTPTVIVKTGPHGTITDRPSSQPFSKNGGIQTKDLIFKVNFSQDIKGGGFNTKAIKCNDIAYLKVTVDGINIGTPLLPAGVDGFDMITPTNKCSEVVTVPNVPYGAARIGKFEAFDSGRTFIPGSPILAVFDVNANPTNVEISYRSTPNGRVVEQILGNPNPLIASHMDLGDLTTLIDGITGKGSTFPNYTYTTHPSLVNIANLVTDLLGNGGDSSALSSGNAAYKIAPATVTGTIAGLAGTDTAQIQITDPASPITTGNGNGAFSFTNTVRDGSWTVYVIGTGGTTYTASGTPTAVIGAGGSVDVGTITLNALTPALVGVTPDSGQNGDTIVLRGDNFHATAAGNVVSFNGTPVPTGDVTVINTTHLSVKVPALGSGTNIPVTVTVGNQTSGGQNFSIVPKVTTVTPASGFADEALELTITGEGFQAGSSVEVDGVLAYNFIFDSINQVRATIAGVNTGTHGVKVINPGSFSDEKPASYTANGRTFSFSLTGTGTGSNPVFSLVVDHTTPANVYAGTDGSAGMYKSTDGGVNWNAINTGLTDLDVTMIAMDPSDNTILYVGTTGGGMFKTTDSGANWTQINTGLGDLNITEIAIDPGTPATLYVGTSGGDRLYKSTDSGANWTTSGAVNGLDANAIQSIAIDPGTPSTLYAGHASKGIYKSTDSGGTWAQLSTGISITAQVFDIAIDPATNANILAIDDQQVCRSTDSGANFSCVGAGNGLPADSLNTLAFNPTAPLEVMVGTGSQIYRSTDNGVNWSIRSTGLVGANTTALAYNPSVTTMIYAATSAGGVQKTTDSGANWNATNQSIGNLNVKQLDIDPVTTSTLYVGTASGLYKTTDSGSSWNLSDTGMPASTEWNAIAVNPGTPATLYAGSGTDSQGIWKSTDNGANWSQLSTGISATAKVWDIVIDPSSNNKIYAVDDQQVCFSSDNGANFTCSSTGLPGNQIGDLAIDSSGSTVYAAMDTQGIWKSTDNGSTWTAINTGLDTNVRAVHVDPVFPNTLYAGTHAGAGVYISTDGGANWSGVTGMGLTNKNTHRLSISPHASGTLFASTHNGIFMSTDSGENWTNINGSMPVNNESRVIVDPNDANKAYVGQDGNGVFRSF